MNTGIPLFIIGGIALLSMLFVGPNLSGTTDYQTASVAQSITEPQEDGAEIVEYRVEPGDTFAAVLGSFEIPYEDTKSILDISKDVYDFTRIKAGQILRVVFVRNAFAAVEYAVDDEKVVIVEKQGDNFAAREENIQYDIEQAVAGATITASLFADASAVEVEDKTILELAEIFGWDIDFAADIRENDSFKIVYERRFKDGKPASPGKILAARFENQGETYWAFFYEDPDGNKGYYNLDGQSLARQFLKSPLNYSYISSGFTYNRLHPVLKTVLPHRAIDYAAPQGTPVVSTADGEVVYAGWKGDNGIYVEVKHGGVYSTQYAHLSRVADKIAKGSRVTQGQVVGYVGSTGISTGPHLQYAMSKNNALVNPLTVELPAGEPIKDEWKDDFNAVKNKFKKLVE